MKYTYLLISLIVILFASCSEDADFLNPSLLKYVGENDVVAFDAKIDDGNLTIFCVSGSTNLSTKFEGNTLQVITIGSNNAVNYSAPSENLGIGFPSNVAGSDNQYTLIWNQNSSPNFKKIEYNGTFSQTALSLPAIIDYTSIVNIHKQENQPYYLLGTGKDKQDDIIYRKIFIVTAENNFSTLKQKTQQEYQADAFGTFGDDDLPVVEELANYFKIIPVKNKILYNAPFKDGMAIKSIGLSDEFATNTNIWITASQYDANKNTLSFVYTDADNTNTFFVPDVTLNEADFPDMSEIQTKGIKLEGWNHEAKICMQKNNDKTIVAGTGISGQVLINAYDNSGNQINSIRIGKEYIYSLVDIEIVNDELVIIGNTKINNQYPRVFIVKIPLEEIFTP